MLEKLKAKNAGFVGQYEWEGQPVWIRRMTAGQWLRVQAKALPAGVEETKGEAGVAMLDFYVEVLALTLCDATGAGDCDSDEGRDELRKLGIGDLTALGQIALKHNGAKDDDDKKN